MGRTEIHFHVLPGVDDGPPELLDSLELARAADADGTRTIIATPHVHPRHITDVTEIAPAVEALRDAMARERIPVEVLAGGELAQSMVGRLGQSELEAIAQGPPGRRWILLEPRFTGMDERYSAAADHLRERGFAVVVAHPERARPSAATSAAVEHEIAAGSVLQLTSWSLTGEYGEDIRAVAWRLLRRAPRVVIASDAHSLERPPSLRAAVAALAAGGVPQADRFVTAAGALLESGLAIPPPALVA